MNVNVTKFNWPRNRRQLNFFKPKQKQNVIHFITMKHFQEVLQEIQDNYRSNLYCDLDILCGNDKVKLSCHRLVIGSALEWLANLIEDDVDVVHIPDFGYEEINGFVDEIYANLSISGEVQFKSDPDLMRLLKFGPENEFVDQELRSGLKRKGNDETEVNCEGQDEEVKRSRKEESSDENVKSLDLDHKELKILMTSEGSRISEVKYNKKLNISLQNGKEMEVRGKMKRFSNFRVFIGLKVSHNNTWEGRPFAWSDPSSAEFDTQFEESVQALKSIFGLLDNDLYYHTILGRKQGIQTGNFIQNLKNQVNSQDLSQVLIM